VLRCFVRGVISAGWLCSEGVLLGNSSRVTFGGGDVLEMHAIPMFQITISAVEIAFFCICGEAGNKNRWGSS
jgi:hypothetical protein